MNFKSEPAFIEYVNALPLNPKGCKIWPYGIKYPLVCIGFSGQIRVHRLVFRLLTPNPITIDNYFVLHSCDNPLCVNIDHLREGTAQNNSNDMKSRERSVFKVTNEEVKEIREVYSLSNLSQRKLAKIYGISQKHISVLVTYTKR